MGPQMFKSVSLYYNKLISQSIINYEFWTCFQCLQEECLRRLRIRHDIVRYSYHCMKIYNMSPSIYLYYICWLLHYDQRLKLTTIDVTQITDTYNHTAATLYIVGNIAYLLPDIIMENLIRWFALYKRFLCSFNYRSFSFAFENLWITYL